MRNLSTHEAAMADEIIAYTRSREPMGLAGPARSDKGKAAFCGAWPAVRDGLAMLEALVPASMRFIIGIVTRTGDVVAGAICPK